MRFAKTEGCPSSLPGITKVGIVISFNSSKLLNARSYTIDAAAAMLAASDQGIASRILSPITGDRLHKAVSTLLQSRMPQCQLKIILKALLILFLHRLLYPLH